MFRVPLIIFNGSSDRQAENFNHKKKKKKNLPHTDFWHAELVCCRFVARKKVVGSPKAK